MPKLHNLERLGPHLAIGVQRGKSVADNPNAGVWYARVQLANQTYVKTTGYHYAGGDKTLRDLAVKKAFEMYEAQGKKVAVGLRMLDQNYATTLIDRKGKDEDSWGYLHEAEQRMEENERLKELGKPPIYMIRGGRTYWTRANYKASLSDMNRYILPFLRQIPRQNGMPPTVESLTERELDGLDEYLVNKHRHLGVETRLGINIELRRFLKWAKEKGFIDRVPQVRRPQRGGVKGARDRMRKEIEPEDYKRIVEWTRQKYLAEDEHKETNIAPSYRDYQYLFHLWILILANTGIRPPTSGTRNTMLRWEHVKIDGSDRQRPTLERPDEKGHAYTAIIMPNAVKYIEELKAFYADKNMRTDKGWVFAHFDDSRKQDGGFRWRRYDPIINFRKQWTNMGIALGLIPEENGKPKKGVPQSKRVSPSSLRSWFITQRLYADDRVDIASLARATGTSIAQIEARYFRVNVKRRYEYLTAGGYQDAERKPKYIEIDGTRYYAGSE